MKLCSKCKSELPEERKDSYCKPCRAEYGRENMRKRRELHPERVGEYQRRWRETHPDQVREAKRRAYHRDVEKSRATAKARRDVKPELYRAQAERRRATAQQHGLDAYYKYGLTLEMRSQLVERQAGKCALCSNVLDELRTKNVHVDHDRDTNAIRGILCGGCNVKLGWFERRIETIRAYLDPGQYLQPVDRSTRQNWT